MIITIDGPAGTGKSTVALAVADALRFGFLDTGAMYRAVALEALRRQTPLDDARELAFVAKHCRIEFDWHRHPPGVILNGEPVTHLLRGEQVTPAASQVAVVGAIREQLVHQQRAIAAQRGDLVTEGRDQGTIVFPNAELKVYLDATPAERARRRVAQLRARGELAEYHHVLQQILSRDHRDASRAVGPLAIPAGAQVIDTTALREDQVVDEIVRLARGRLTT
jgi:cytidylate kinase